MLVIPEDAYSSSYLQEEPLDKSYDFISHCAAHGYHIRWARLSRSGAGAAGWGLALPAARVAAPGAPPHSAKTPLPHCLSSITTGLCLVAATRWVPQAPHVTPLGASVPAGPMSSAATAPAVPPATGAFQAAGVSTRVAKGDCLEWGVLQSA